MGLRIATLIFSCLVIILFPACTTGESKVPEKKTKIPLVKVKKIHQEVVQIPIYAAGQLQKSQQIKLGFPYGGVIAHLRGEHGQMVSKGQILASLDTRSLEGQKTEVEIKLASARQDLMRAEQLYQDTVITLEQLEKARSLVQSLETGLSNSILLLAANQLRAPSKGKILRRMAERNEVVGPGSPVFLFAPQHAPWTLQTHVSGQARVKLNLGDSAAVRFDAFPGKHFNGYVNELHEIPDPLTGTFQVNIQLVPDSKNPWVNGLIGEASIFPKASQLYWIIPADAYVQGKDQSAFVYVAEADSVRKLAIEVMHIMDDHLAVKTDIDQPVSVITTYPSGLKTGMKVNIQ